MPKWNVIGFAGAEGKQVRLAIEAETAEAAFKRAKAGGLMVAHVLPEGEEPPPPKPRVVAPAPVATTPGPVAAVPAAGPKRIPCPSCAELILPAANVCPFCKHAVFARTPGRNALIGLVASVAAFFVLYYAISAFSQHEARRETDRIWKESREESKRLMQESQADLDEVLRDAQRRADEAARRAGGR